MANMHGDSFFHAPVKKYTQSIIQYQVYTGIKRGWSSPEGHSGTSCQHNSFIWNLSHALPFGSHLFGFLLKVGISRKDPINSSQPIRTPERMEQERRHEECWRDKAKRRAEGKKDRDWTRGVGRKNGRKQGRWRRGSWKRDATVLFNKTCYNLWGIHFSELVYCLSWA